MAWKNQNKCFRNIRGIRYENYADLIYGDAENAVVISNAMATGRRMRLVKHKDGYRQLFLQV